MSDGLFRHRGALAELDTRTLNALLNRGAAASDAVRADVAAIVARVRREGDGALREMAREFDGATLDALEVPRERCREAWDALEPALREALQRAAHNIAAFHRAGLPESFEFETEPGVRIGRRPDPLGSVGVYAPGGRAAYPSSVLMGAIPARAAGVGTVVLCSPPGQKGLPNATVLAAAECAGVDRVFAVGGAGAIAALAYGTASVPRVDRIVGPGNAWVAEAKLQVTGACSIDSPAGPSELLVIADDHADPEMIALEMLAQAEHDPDATVVTLAMSEAMAKRIEAALERALADAPRRAVIATALGSRGALLVARHLEAALDFSADFAPEHLLLAILDPHAALSHVRNAGTVCLGGSSSVAIGDYMTGANHTLPTGGLARSYSGLSTLDFMRWTTWQSVSAGAAARLAGDVRRLAEAEGLPAHAAAAAWGRV